MIRIIDTSYWYPIIDPTLVNHCRKAVLRQLELSSLDKCHSAVRFFSAGLVQERPDLFAAGRSRLPEFLSPLVELLLAEGRVVGICPFYALANSLLTVHNLYLGVLKVGDFQRIRKVGSHVAPILTLLVRTGGARRRAGSRLLLFRLLAPLLCGAAILRR